MKMKRLESDDIRQANAKVEKRHEADLGALRGLLERRGIDMEQIMAAAAELEVAVPSWGFMQGGTRFGRFSMAGEPRDIFEKLEDAAVVKDLVRITPRVSLHVAWDKPDDVKKLKRLAKDLGLGFDAMNSDMFEDRAGQQHSYKFGSFSNTRRAVRKQAVEHNIECIEFGKQVGSNALSVWLPDGSCFPGQQHFRRALDRTMGCLREIYGALPSKWRVFIEHKPYEPAFYSTVVQDWGTSLMIAQALGPKAECLVDLGHHLPNTNIEQVVARLIAAGRLAGFHFNDSKYGDDDLSSGSIKPYQLFLVFNELLDAARDRKVKGFKPAYMIDQSHNLKDPIEDLVQSSVEIHRAYTKALLIDRKALEHWQEKNDPVMAELTLKRAYETDVSPILAEVRRRMGGAIDPIRAYRDSGYRSEKARERG